MKKYSSIFVAFFFIAVMVTTAVVFAESQDSLTGTNDTVASSTSTEVISSTATSTETNTATPEPTPTPTPTPTTTPAVTTSTDPEITGDPGTIDVQSTIYTQIISKYKEYISLVKQAKDIRKDIQSQQAEIKKIKDELRKQFKEKNKDKHEKIKTLREELLQLIKQRDDFKNSDEFNENNTSDENKPNKVITHTNVDKKDDQKSDFNPFKNRNKENNDRKNDLIDNVKEKVFDIFGKNEEEKRDVEEKNAKKIKNENFKNGLGQFNSLIRSKSNEINEINKSFENTNDDDKFNMKIKLFEKNIFTQNIEISEIEFQIRGLEVKRKVEYMLFIRSLYFGNTDKAKTHIDKVVELKGEVVKCLNKILEIKKSELESLKNSSEN